MFKISNILIAVGALSGGFISIPALSQVSVPQDTLANLKAVIALTEKQPSSDFDVILRQLRSVILTVQSTLKTDSLPQLKSVEIDLQTGVTLTLGGQVTIFVITIGGSTSTQTTQTMKFILTPPTGTAEDLSAAWADSTTPNFSAQFSAAIIAAAQAADIALTNQQKPALELNSFTADVKFTVENIVQGGVNTLTLVPVNLQVSGKVDPTNTHEAILTFAKPTPSGPGH